MNSKNEKHFYRRLNIQPPMFSIPVGNPEDTYTFKQWSQQSPMLNVLKFYICNINVSKLFVIILSLKNTFFSL